MTLESRVEAAVMMVLDCSLFFDVMAKHTILVVGDTLSG